jgi:hypothetical protein
VTGRLRSLGILGTGIVIGLLIAAATAGALNRAALADLFGSNMIRAQVVIFSGGQDTEIWFNRGRITAVDRGSITLREKDGQVDRVPISSGARITVNNFLVGSNALRRGMTVAVFRSSQDGPAYRVDATAR